MAYAKLITPCKLHEGNCSWQCNIIQWMKHWSTRQNKKTGVKCFLLLLFCMLSHKQCHVPKLLFFLAISYITWVLEEELCLTVFFFATQEN